MAVAARLLVAVSLLAATACGTVRVPNAAVAGYVPWAPLPPANALIEAPLISPSPPYPIPAGTPACRASDLEGLAAHSEGATGNVDMPIVFRDKGAADCVVAGFPDVSVLDAAGRVLATARGSTGAGTYFDDGPVEPILARAGTPALTAMGWDATRAGQLFINLSWYDCRRPWAAALAVDLPGGGGRLMVRFPQQAAYYMLCDTRRDFAALSRGPFSPVGMQWPPDLHRYIATSVSINVPASVKAGSSLVFYVTVTNHDTIDYVLAPCPDYLVFLGPKTVVWRYILNCAPAGRIAAGRGVTFQMRLAVPSTVARGTYPLEWALDDFRIADGRASAQVEVSA